MPHLQTKTFPSLHVATAATGIGLVSGMSFSQVQQIYDHVLGFPVWTHELPRYGEEVRRLLSEQFALMPSREAAEENWRTAGEAMLAAYGPEVEVTRGTGERTASPVDTLREIVDPEKIIVVSA
jgi:hypothetical protein